MHIPNTGTAAKFLTLNILLMFMLSVLLSIIHVVQAKQKSALCARKLNTCKEILEQVVYIFFSFLWCAGAVFLSSVQGLAINVDPVLYTWLIYQPQKRVSRHIQQVCIFGGNRMGRGEAFTFVYANSAFFQVFAVC